MLEYSSKGDCDNDRYLTIIGKATSGESDVKSAPRVSAERTSEEKREAHRASTQS